jgi:hypothetical protein
VATSEKKHERKKCQIQKDVQTNSKQQEGRSRFRDDKGKPDQEKVASSEKDVEKEKCQGQRTQEIMQSTAVTTRRSDFLPIGSPFSL